MTDATVHPGWRRCEVAGHADRMLTRRFLEEHGIEADIRLSYGATEAKVPDIADAVVEITETGRALATAGLRVLETLLVSRTELIASPKAAADSTKLHAMRQLQTLLHSMKSPTVSKLFGERGYAVETVDPKTEINELIPALKDNGATDMTELALAKIVH